MPRSPIGDLLHLPDLPGQGRSSDFSIWKLGCFSVRPWARGLACTLPLICFLCAGMEPSLALVLPCNPFDSQGTDTGSGSIPDGYFSKCHQMKLRGVKQQMAPRNRHHISWNIWKADNYVEWSFLSVIITFFVPSSEEPLALIILHTTATDGAHWQASDLKNSRTS